MRCSGLVLSIALLALCIVPAYAVVPTQNQSIAVLRGLDKTTARVLVLGVPIGKPTEFGDLSITVRTCKTTLPEEPPEAVAFLDISENKAGEGDVSVFHGWMFASSPAVSAMEHPVYDIWLVGCKTEEKKDDKSK